MKFIDEANIQVQAGNGGPGCLSFRREKYIARGGPDGGDGGKGGDVILRADSDLNTLVDFRYQPLYKGGNGGPGSGRNRTGADGDTCYIRVPVGTSVIDDTTSEALGDLASAGEELLVAIGGQHGLGNTRFKSSINRAPRRTTTGASGEARRLKLQLRLLADVGLLGMPNAGKSTFLRAVSAARPKVADYPFTTLVPSLGVVALDRAESFVVADIPGLIAGAAEGAGLGFQFLRHLSRTHVLLHLVDCLPSDGSDPAVNVDLIHRELAIYSSNLKAKTIWLVLTKIDLLDQDNYRQLEARLHETFPDFPLFGVSSTSRLGLENLNYEIGRELKQMADRRATDPTFFESETAINKKISRDVFVSALKERKPKAFKNDRDSFDNAEVIYEQDGQ